MGNMQLRWLIPWTLPQVRQKTSTFLSGAESSVARRLQLKQQKVVNNLGHHFFRRGCLASHVMVYKMYSVIGKGANFMFIY